MDPENPPIPGMEYKALPVEFKATGDAGEYEGYFSVTGNVDDGGDVIHSGAFTKTLQERGKRIKVFYAHDWQKLIGPPPAVIREDEHGLFASGRLTLDSMWGREAWVLMKDGAMTEGSIGYEPIKIEYESADGEPITDVWDAFKPGTIRHLKEVKLYEISPVPLGMNPLTAIRAVKSAAMQRHFTPDALEGYLKLFAHFAEELKAGRMLSAASKEKLNAAKDALQAAMDALADLLAAADPADTDDDDPKTAASALRLKTRLRAAGLALALTQHA